MVFSSIIFIFYFLPIALLLYFILPKFLRNTTLFVLSIIFYAWGEIEYTIVIIFSILMNYVWGLLVYRYQETKFSNVVIGFSIVSNIGILVYFKYTNFLIENINIILEILSFQQIQPVELHLPLGISFFTFQAMSYVIDVHRNKAIPQRNVVNLGLYIALFPQLIAGPIVRYGDIAQQLLEREITRGKISAGIQRFIIGLSKKSLIANNLGLVSDQIFALNMQYIGTDLAWLGMICYTLQIYFDFSGYSDMAIGLGLIFGFKIPENFNFPYIAKSIREFWRRWHITLSNWFRDYLYIPLGGNRKSVTRTYMNLYIIFFLTGLWHGASWNFIIWGLIHGTFLVLERVFLGEFLERIPAVFQHLYTLFVVIVAWVFFRAETLPHAIEYIQKMFVIQPSSPLYNVSLLLNNLQFVALLLGIIFSIPIVKISQAVYNKLAISDSKIVVTFNYACWFVTLVGLFMFSTMSLIAGTYNPFIYFRF